MNIKLTLKDCVEIAKSWTTRYAKNHVGRNKLEKECIKNGYLIKRYGEIFPDCVECQKNKIGVFALDFNVYSRRGEFVAIR